MTKISLVTDSTCDLPDDLVKKYESRRTQPDHHQGQECQDGKELSRQEFYERLPAMSSPPTTATASQGLTSSCTKNSCVSDHKIISIHAASALSGIFNAAQTAAQAFNEHVFVIDSGQISLGLGFQVLEAAEAIEQGASFERVVDFLVKIRERVRVMAMLDTLEYVRRSGRVSWMSAHLGNLMRIKLFLEVKAGEVLRAGEARTRRKGIERLKQHLVQLGPLQRLAILHTNALDEAQQILVDIDQKLPSAPLVVNVTTVIGAHVGPNGLGFAAVIA
jgi:DegV family protein with EDD domain